jgi:hypothetical protein
MSLSPVLARADFRPCAIELKLFNNFLVQKWAVCRKTNVYAPLPTPPHNFSTTNRQKFVEMEERDFLENQRKRLLQETS